ncbi:hypothetical protein Pla163_07780 [Planctomycetes bacterium Pla163]|uniref:Uncharacterized protein n=1 Tax=Rohdeia mirabilis TaxID=2528008 RepID=A0A518CWS0_9BACT|nr:hypothetical protein Pla163_07780 [Planctomycetes bacterium Pla163]
MHPIATTFVSAALLLGLTAGPTVFAVDADQDPAPPTAVPAQDEAPTGALAQLLATLSEEGVDLDLDGGLVSIEAAVGVRSQLVEYLLVGPGGATHESLLYTRVTPSLLNAGLLALGANPGRNARWVEVEPEPPLGEAEGGSEAEAGDDGEAADAPLADRPRFRIVPPHGDGFYLYTAWREEDEVFFFRVEDLVANLETGRAMQRAPFVFLGSRMATIAGMVRPLERDEEERPADDEMLFIADYERNLINLVYFREGNTLLTASHGEGTREDVWAANIWNLPDTDQPLRLIFSREKLERVPEGLVDGLPLVVRPDEPARW